MKNAVLALALLITSTLLPSSVFAHEGHDKTPGSIAAPHGGIVKRTEHLYLEIVSDKDGFKIYPLDHDGKALSTTDLQIEGKVTFPKGKKSEVVKFANLFNAFEAKIDAKGAHRYSLDLKVTRQGKSEKVNFSVEP